MIEPGFSGAGNPPAPNKTDFQIRHETKNRSLLDTVMRALYREYFRDRRARPSGFLLPMAPTLVGRKT